MLPSLNFPQLDFVKPSSGFHPVTWERVSVYVAQVEDVKFFIVAYIDDFILVSNNKDKLLQVKEKLSRKFTMKDLGDFHFFLGMEVEMDRAQHFLYVNQIGYFKEILKCFRMEDYKAIGVPLDPKTKLKNNENKDVKMVKAPYKQAMGSFMLANCVLGRIWHIQ